MTLLVLTLAVGICTFAAVALVVADPRRSWVQARLGPYLPVARRTPAAAGAEHRRLARLGSHLRESAAGGLLTRVLERAGSDWTADHLAVIVAGAAFAAGALALAAGVGAAGALLLALVAAAAPLVVLRVRAVRRARAFDAQLPDVLDLLAGSLRVGHAFEHSLRAVAEEAAEPAASEFRRALGEIRLGRPAADALGGVGDRVSSDDLPFVLTAIEIQHQVGGSLADLLALVAGTVRSRQQFRRKVRAVTGMGRMTAGTLIALPFVAGAGLTALRPDYMAPLWHTSTGHLLVLLAAGMVATGSLVLRRIVAVRH